MEPLQTPPDTSSFVLLADHQSRTPSSFHSGPAVLHYHSKRCKLVTLEHEVTATPALHALRSDAAAQAPSQNGEEEAKELVIEGVDIWVTSDKLLLYNPTIATGVSIPYPSISLHAIQRLTVSGTEVQGLYMQISVPETMSQEDDFEECITVTVVPAEGDRADGEDQEETPTQALYNAVSACSNLHPDPMSDDEGEAQEEAGSALFGAGLVQAGDAEGGLPPPVDGSSGWITADNMHEYFDEEGNWIAGGEEPNLALGPGAGTVRDREENGEEDEAKWRRTD
ncbi:hypothetical protein BDV25DRAFT_170395 [Aspergillus avenaceus]|uniref:Regulator of volume decrease after cellular swelling-domain-containing protein n=1 Tax=Aspergillus avenaceus TaxID=36643 RepID=A0A5N6U1L6_ASPAV|nr:hypothetical protein BDV25DRAFT_170395 [Aspergillus avenaceus]